MSTSGIFLALAWSKRQVPRMQSSRDDLTIHVQDSHVYMCTGHHTPGSTVLPTFKNVSQYVSYLVFISYMLQPICQSDLFANGSDPIMNWQMDCPFTNGRPICKLTLGPDPSANGSHLTARMLYLTHLPTFISGSSLGFYPMTMLLQVWDTGSSPKLFKSWTFQHWVSQKNWKSQIWKKEVRNDFFS